jgi:dTDP-4-dehydrorhamnose reductase
MTAKHFFTAIEGYYGKYPRPFLRSEVAEHIKTIKESELDTLYHYIKHTVSTRYGFIPDIEAIELARREMRKANIGVPEYKPQLPDPNVRSMKLETGEMLKHVLSKVSLRRKRENEKAAG